MQLIKEKKQKVNTSNMMKTVNPKIKTDSTQPKHRNLIGAL